MLEAIKVQSYSSPLGEMCLASYREQLCLCDWTDCKDFDKIQQRLEQGLGAQYIRIESPILIEVKRQLDAYFDGRLQVFDIPLLFVGTDFEQRVWAELCRIPYGATISYLDLATRVATAKAVRAVAQANAKNLMPIIVPCHRVLMSTKGDIGGFSSGIDRKVRLLCLEQGISVGQINLFSD